jgi:hypothetical protein
MYSGRRSVTQQGMLLLALMGLLSFSTLPFVAAILDESFDVVTWMNSIGGGAEEEEEKNSAEDLDNKVPVRLHALLAFQVNGGVRPARPFVPVYLFHPEIATPPPEDMMMG